MLPQARIKIFIQIISVKTLIKSSLKQQVREVIYNQHLAKIDKNTTIDIIWT
jgi:hypothetical protein